MTCANPDRSQLFALSANEMALSGGASLASSRLQAEPETATTSAESIAPQPTHGTRLNMLIAGYAKKRRCRSNEERKRVLAVHRKLATYFAGRDA